MDSSVTSRTPFSSVTSLSKLKALLRLALIGRALEEMGTISCLDMVSSWANQTTISSEMKGRKGEIKSKPVGADSLHANRICTQCGVLLRETDRYRSKRNRYRSKVKVVDKVIVKSNMFRSWLIRSERVSAIKTRYKTNNCTMY